MSVNNLANALYAQGKHADAEPLFREALEIRRRTLPSGHPLLANNLNDAAGMLRGQGKIAEAEPLVREALEIYRKSLPPNHPDLGSGACNLAILLAAQGKHAEAHPLFREAGDTFSVSDGKDAWRVGVLRLLHGQTLMKLDRRADAEDALIDAERINRTAPDAPPGRYAETIDSLVTLYDGWNTAEPDKGYDAREVLEGTGARGYVETDNHSIEFMTDRDDTSRGNEVKEIFLQASELSPAERAEFLDHRCAGNDELRRAVESLLVADEGAGDFFAQPTTGAGTTEATQPATVPREPIGPYKLLQVIGEGGFGTVYMADQSHPVRRRVALKIIKVGMDTRAVIARFEAERQALAMMDHPNIARVFDAGETANGRPYFVMELVKGIPITKFCDNANLSLERRLDLFGQVCHALQHAHTKGIIHRDIKPTNILVFLQDDRAVAKVIDFGIAKATQSRLTEKTLFTEFRQLVGTPEYMSPEQADGSLDIDTRTDIYSLGVLLYELLTGTTPFDGKELRSKAYGEIQRMIRDVDPPRPSTRLSAMKDTLATVAARRQLEPRKLNTEVRGDLDWIVMKALEKDRSRRYETASALIADVARHLANEPVIAGPPNSAYRLRKFIRRHRNGVTLTATATLLVIVGTAVYIRGIRSEQHRTNLANAELKVQRDEAERQKRDAQAARQDTQAVNEFLAADVLGAADPAVAQGKEVSVKQALDNAAKSVGEKLRDRPTIEASVRMALAQSYEALGHVDIALLHAQAALEIRRKLLGPDHFDTIDSESSVALYLQYQANYSAAEPLCRDAVARSIATLGPDDPHTLRRQFNLATLLDDLGKLNDAQQIHRQVLQARRRVLGEDDPDTIGSINYLAKSLGRQGRLDEAESLSREALAKRRRVQGNLHPQTLIAISDLALGLRNQAKLDQAESLYREAYAGMQTVLGEEHPSTLIVCNNLAELLMFVGRLDEAEQLYRLTMERCRRVNGENHPDTVAFATNLARLLDRLGRSADAETIYKQALAGSRRVNGEEHPTTILIVGLLAEHYETQLRPADAEPLLKEMYEKVSKVEGDPRAIARATGLYGLFLVKQNRFAEAEASLRASIDRLRAANAENGPSMRQAMTALAQVCDATNRPEESAALRKQLDAMPPPASAPSSTSRPPTRP
ncbi:MAG: tetratricopeptide repeat protein [Anaerolineae bacterium]|nr:tetratricopeptide repeat protein [Phycisphaerae bacterium]